MTKQANMVKFWTAKFLPMSIVIRVKRKTIRFLMANKPITSPIITITLATLVGETIPPTFLSTSMITAGAGALGTILGYGILAGAGVDITAGAGTTPGDLTVGAGMLAGAGIPDGVGTPDGAGLVLASDGVDTTAGVATTVVTGTVPTTTEVIMVEVTPT